MADEAIEVWMQNTDEELVYLQDQLKKDKTMVTIALVAGAGGIALGLMANATVLKLMKTLVALNEAVTSHHQILTGGMSQNVGPDDPRFTAEHVPPVRPDRSDAPRHLRVEDQTITDDIGKVAEPAMGPMSEASERVRRLIEDDPLSPGALVDIDGIPLESTLRGFEEN